VDLSLQKPERQDLSNFLEVIIEGENGAARLVGNHRDIAVDEMDCFAPALAFTG
jgi:hypothetical protein